MNIYYSVLSSTCHPVYASAGHRSSITLRELELYIPRGPNADYELYTHHYDALKINVGFKTNFQLRASPDSEIRG